MDKNSVFSKFIRYLTISIILWNLPSFILIYGSSTISSLISYFSFGLILLYTIVNGKSGNDKPLLIFGILFFTLSSLAEQKYMPEFLEFIIIIIKYFIIIWGGYEIMKHSTKKEIWIIMLIGSLSIIGNMFLFNDPKADYGRYSGFYLDPNNAGLICLIGFSITYAMPKKYRLVGKLLFTILGLLTFSRTFILSWLLINLLSIRLSFKNARMLLFGFGLLSMLLIFNEFLPVKNQRLEQIGAVFSGDSKKAAGINKDSRWHTWSRYFEPLFENPLSGNGYGSFGSKGIKAPVGVHNTYLLIWGESGILPIIIFILYIIYLLYEGNKVFKSSPHLLMMTLALSIFILTNHNFLTNYYSILLYVWIHLKIKEKSNLHNINYDMPIVKL
ncbi:O-antigen ligase family protein [Maribacter sp. Asnod1-A12]|uniref:O-antigen ligase family protein n=1 Tax=Maribacter sp. Asnod1-A12 TaxID=3160576 RepID=UPI003862DAF8